MVYNGLQMELGSGIRDSGTDQVISFTRFVCGASVRAVKHSTPLGD